MKDKLVSPGLLALAAAAAPFVLAVRGWWFYTYVDPRPELDFLAIPIVIFLIFLGLVITFYGARSIIGTEHRRSGSMVLAGSLLSGMLVIPGIVSIPALSDGLVTAGLSLSCSLGIVGGLKGIYWEMSWREGAAIPELAGYSRWAVIGGLVLLCFGLVQGIFYPVWTSPDLTTLLGSFIVPVSAALVYKGKGNRRLLGFTIVAGALLGGPVLSATLSYNFRVTNWEILGLVGTVLSVIPGLKILTWKTTAPAAPRGGEPSQALPRAAPRRVIL